MKPVDANPDFVAIEYEILNFWDKNKCFFELMKKNENGPTFRFLDGPITANNPMGVHHAWGRTLKDIFLRYKALNGYRSHYQNGFDCQGLWVEVEVEKELGFRGKPDIIKFGLENFSNACKARVDKFSKIQTQQSIRLGQWMDWENSYYTHRDSNILGIWYFLKKCHENGWIYQSSMPMSWCTRCGTSLSEHEMSGSHKEVSHLSVFIKIFSMERNAFILVWTTTPWTLAANVALAVNPKLEYCEVETEDEKLPIILCCGAMHTFVNVIKKKQYKILMKFQGKDLIGVKYEPIFPELAVQRTFEHKIIEWDEVDPKEGTGIVHIAPGCGKEDYELGVKLGLTILSPVNEEGIYMSGYDWLEGKNAINIAEEVIDKLNQKGKLFHSYLHQHSYPICWRCKHEIIFRLVDEWYISCEKIRPLLLEAAAKVQWKPDFIGKRMEDWLRNMGDWCISRKRFWGLPLPFYPCNSCGTLTVVGSLEELKQLSADPVDSLTEIHRPWIDEIRIKCLKCGNKVTRIHEVGDCWLDAGIVPHSTRGYFKDKNKWKQWYPAEWICEMREQVRLWFYSMLFMGVTLDNRAPYERVLTYERVVSEEGTPFSKTGFMIRFDEASEKMGVDTMRYLYAKQNPAYELRFGYSLGDEARRHLLFFWNIYVFFVTYARLDKPDFSTINKPTEKLTISDRWLLARLYQFITRVKTAMDDYNTPVVIREFDSFADDVSTWYVRINRRRFWMGDLSEDKNVGYWVLYQAIKNTAIVMSPIIPFMTEAIWQNAIRNLEPAAPISVHLANWPMVDNLWQNDEILTKTEDIRKVINLALRLRNQSQIKVRQPLPTLYVGGNQQFIESSKSMEAIIRNELNIKNLEYLDKKDSLQDEYLEIDFRKGGPILKQNLLKVKNILENLSIEQMEQVTKQVKANKLVELSGYDQKIPPDVFVVKNRPRIGIVFEQDGDIIVALNTRITQDLLYEGWIRDILRQCQILRKDSGLNVEDRIYLALSTTSDLLKAAIESHAKLLKEETLALDLVEHIDKPLGVTEITFENENVRIALRKA